MHMTMTSNSIFSSSSSEQRWVNQISETLEKDSIIDIDVCIFQVPKTLTSVNPEAYFPDRIGLGPYHHLRPDLHKLENHKLAAAKRVLKASPIKKPQKLLIQKIKESELPIRAFYDHYLDLDGDTLACIFAIDGLFLLDHLSIYYCNTNPNIIIADATRKSAQDIMMLENQIPLFLLKLIGKFLQVLLDDSLFDDVLLSNFSEAHSPLELNQQFQFRHNINHVHLLGYMYYLIVNNRGLNDISTGFTLMMNSLELEEVIDDGKKIASAAEKVLGVIGVSQDVMKPFQLIQALPWQDIIALFKKTDQNETGVEEIEIPSASQLSSIARINFTTTTGGIRDIKFDEELRTLNLPVIKVNVDSEVILRNLVAYEASMVKPGSTLELAEYVDLMCGIVDTAEDVKLLREKGIIDQDGLSDEEIAKLFNGISKSSSGNVKGKSGLGKAIEKVNEQFENKPRVKAYRLVKKYGYASWKLLTVIATIVLVLLLILQSICQIYGCSTRFFGYHDRTLSYRDS